MKLLLKELNTPWLPYDPKCDPTRQPLSEKEIWQEEFTKREWTLGARAVSTTRKRLSHPENKAEPKAKKTKDKNQEKPIPCQTNNSANAIGEGSKQDGEVDSVKVEETGDKITNLKEEKQNDDLVNQSETIVKEESAQLLEESGSV